MYDNYIDKVDASRLKFEYVGPSKGVKFLRNGLVQLFFYVAQKSLFRIAAESKTVVQYV